MPTEIDPTTHCLTCWEARAERRPVVTTYRDRGFCESCKVSWVNGQRSLDNVMVDLPAALRRAKAASGLRSKVIAHRAGVSEQAVSLYMREADPTSPGLETFLRLCLAMRTHPNELTGFTDPRRTQAEIEARHWGKCVSDIVQRVTEAGVYGGDKPALNLDPGTRRERDEENPYHTETSTY